MLYPFCGDTKQQAPPVHAGDHQMLAPAQRTRGLHLDARGASRAAGTAEAAALQPPSQTAQRSDEYERGEPAPTRRGRSGGPCVAPVDSAEPAGKMSVSPPCPLSLEARGSAAFVAGAISKMTPTTTTTSNQRMTLVRNMKRDMEQPLPNACHPALYHLKHF